ncbi:uncharacterized protein LOC106091371 isoform X1 [Stomoxys calcitrans]|nr:uncharacterized protein LOC106091371 isoform X1 [Stomoxys calcitrans]
MRWNFYKTLELWSTKLGLHARECVLKSICEANQFKFYNEMGDLWHEVAHILFSPFSSVDPIRDDIAREYFAAAYYGLAFKCNKVFTKCPKSLLNAFSVIF